MAKQQHEPIKKRCPNGYHFERWADGSYHVYFGGDCLDEVMSKKDAIKTAWEHKEHRLPTVDTVTDAEASH